MTKLLRLAGLVLGVTVVAAAHPCSAQSRPPIFVAGTASTFSVNADEVDGQSFAGGLAGGVAISRVVDVEVEWILPARSFTRSTTAIGVSFATPGSSREEIERLGVLMRFDRRRDVSANVSAVVIVHPPFDRRVVPGFIVGVSNQRARVRFATTPLTIPPGVDPQHPSVVAHEETSTRNFGALTVGGNLAIAITPHIFVVPEVRYDYGSIGDEINTVLRSGVRVMWRL